MMSSYVEGPGQLPILTSIQGRGPVRRISGLAAHKAGMSQAALLNSQAASFLLCAVLYGVAFKSRLREGVKPSPTQDPCDNAVGRGSFVVEESPPGLERNLVLPDRPGLWRGMFSLFRQDK